MSRHPAPSDLLVRHAPRHDEVSGLNELLLQVREQEAVGRQRRRRTVRLAVGVAIVVVTVLAVVLLPAGTRSPVGAAVALDRLALTAAQAPEVELSPGAFLHTVEVENPGSESEYTGAYYHPDRHPLTVESWTSSEGEVWRQDTTPDGGREWSRFKAFTGNGGIPGTSPQDLASLPTDPQALLEQLRPRVQGSLSTDEAVFAWLQAALRTGNGPPQNRRAMISALPLLPHIETERRFAYDGRPCLEVRFAEPLRPGTVQGMCFDETTAGVIEERLLEDGELAGRTIEIRREIVPAVPAEVLANAEAPEYED